MKWINTQTNQIAKFLHMTISRKGSDIRPPTMTQQIPVQECPGTVQINIRENYKIHSTATNPNQFQSEGGYYMTTKYGLKTPPKWFGISIKRTNKNKSLNLKKTNNLINK